MNDDNLTEGRVSRRAFIAAAGMAAATSAVAASALAAEASAPADGAAPAGGAPTDGAAGGAPAEGGPAGGIMSATPTTPPYSGEDDVARVDANGDTVYYSMRRNWVGEAPQIADADVAQTIDADVVVLGLGYSGSQCFRMAAEKGLTVVGVDAQAKDGFTTYGGQLGHFNSTWQEEVLGVPKDTFDPVDFIDSYQLQSAGRAQPDLIRQFAFRNGEMVDWMMELQPDLSAVTGVDTIDPNSGYSYKKGYFWTYPAVINLGSGAFSTSGEFCTASVDAGISASPDSQALYGHSAQVLLKDDSGRVSGAIVRDDESGDYVRVNAKVGVVLACGDFSANSDMYSALCTEVQECNPYTQLVGSGRDGYGIKMGIWAGGVMEIGPRAAMGGATSALPMGFFGAASGCWINKYGKRFCNEAFGVPFVAGCQSARQPIDSDIIQVWDAGHWRAFASNQALGHFNASDISSAKMDEYQTKLDEAYAAGAEGANGVYAADDLETLAGYLGLEGEAATNFVESVQRYSGFAEAGRDEDYAKPADMMWPIDEPPFYAEKNTRNANIVLVTLSGLFVNGDQQVLDQHFEPIPGLFATGNCSGGRFPLQYTAPMNGISIGFATVFGALLGEHLGAQA
ncbi:MAG: FAD-binding protein [Coriobacteriales bacterium]|jgi:succinate dehydrogenase/fumarate reductase flavoprotein subunit